MTTARRPARTLPFEWYTDPAVLRLEHERIFRRHWQYVGNTAQVAEPGSIGVGRVGDVPVLMTRDADDVLRCFVNVCRHRGSRLVAEDCSRSTIQCPYHAWTYALDGSLRAAPRADDDPGFDARDFGLVPLAIDNWGPFLFANPDVNAPPLAEWLGDLPAEVERLGVDVNALRFHMRDESALDANWKIVSENFLECYHCQVAHPELVKVIDTSEDGYRLEEAATYSTQFGPVRPDWSGDFDPSGAIGSGLFCFIFPNTTLNVSPGHPNVSIGPILPETAETASRYLDYFFAPETDAGWIDELLAWDAQVGQEDTHLVEQIQQGVRSGIVPDGVLVESERLIAHFDGFVRSALES